MKDKLKKLFANTTARERRSVDFDRDFLDYKPGIGSEALARLQELFPKKVHLNKTKKANLMIDIAWSSSVLEGNLYSQLDTQKLLQYGTIAKNASDEDTQMIINHKHAFDLIQGTSEISLRMLREIHRLIANPGKIEGLTQHFVLKDELGAIRTTEVMEVVNTAYVPPFYWPGTGKEQIYDLIDHVMNTANEIENPVECAFYIMTRVPYVQAFADCNKRTSRMMANIPLLSNGCMPISFEIMKKHDYVEALLGVYEFSNTSIFRDVFLASYVDSYLKYYPLPRELDKDIRLNLKQYQSSLAAYVCDGKDSELVLRIKLASSHELDDDGCAPR